MLRSFTGLWALRAGGIRWISLRRFHRNPYIDGDHYFQGLAFMEQELKKISRWERRRPFYLMPPLQRAKRC